jgi:hypothetical protein
LFGSYRSNPLLIDGVILQCLNILANLPSFGHDRKLPLHSYTDEEINPGMPAREQAHIHYF